MQRCPYIHEMKERLLTQRGTDSMPMESFNERDNLLEHTSRPGSNQVGTVGTVVKVRVSSFDMPEKVQVVQFNSDGYHISPTHHRTPLVPRDLGEDFSIDCEESECMRPLDPKKPKNAKGIRSSGNGYYEYYELKRKRLAD